MLVVGIDIGGTKMRGILWNGKRVVRVREIPTPKNRRDFEGKLLALVPQLAGKGHIDGIGIGAAGIVAKRTLLFSPNISYISNFNFGSLWPRSIRLQLDNDARCFGRAEFLIGAGRGSKSLFALTVGTGIGRAYGSQGRIIKIKRFEFPEQWEKRYQRLRDSRDCGKLAEFLGEKLAGLMKPFTPEVVVIGGGVIERHRFFPMLRLTLKSHGLNCPIRRSSLGKNAVTIGAAMLVSK
jgi:predicted NBD/HSP70 family sugar kinase